MKTERQVKEHLQSQLWADVYCYNVATKGTEGVFNNYTSIEKVEGKLKEETISYAFQWEHTREGDSFWEFIDIAFYRWYNEE